MVFGTQPLPKGERVAILTHSGGPGAAAADAADRSGLELASFTSETVEALRELVPHTASTTNPVDLTFNRNPADYVEKIPAVLLQDPNVDALFIYLLLPLHRVRRTINEMTKDPEKSALLADQFIKAQAAALEKLVPRFGKPLVGASFDPRSEPFVQELQKRSIPLLPSPERAVRALGALARYARFRRYREQKDKSTLCGLRTS